VGAFGPASTPRNPAHNAARENLLRDIRLRLRAEAARDSHSLSAAAPADIRGLIEAMVDRVIGQTGYAVTRDERLSLVDLMVAEIVGFGPLEPLLKDETITEIMVNGPGHIYIERNGKLLLTRSAFLDDDDVLRVIERIVGPLGRHAERKFEDARQRGERDGIAQEMQETVATLEADFLLHMHVGRGKPPARHDR
jgi:hypothetical protein